MSVDESPKVEYYYRTLRELEANSPAPFADPNDYWGAINPNKREAILNNVAKYTPDEICQIIALVDGMAAGYITLFKGRTVVDGKEIEVQHGSDLFAHPDYRKLMIGAELLILAKDLQQKPCIFAGLSEYALPLYPKLGFRMFSYPRFIFLFKNKVIVEHSRRIPRLIKKPAAFALDTLQLPAKIKTLRELSVLQKRFQTEAVDDIPNEIEGMIARHSRTFQELHDKRWFDFVMNHSFEQDKEEATKNKKLYLVKEKGETVGFFVIRYRNSSVGNGAWPNLRTAELKEWESSDYGRLSETDICHLAIGAAKEERADSIAFAIFNRDSEDVISRKFRPQGTYDVAVYFPGKKKSDPIYDKNNWRIRDGYSDTLID